MRDLVGLSVGNCSCSGAIVVYVEMMVVEDAVMMLDNDSGDRTGTRLEKQKQKSEKTSQRVLRSKETIAGQH
jgi:hypothetical protein